MKDVARCSLAWMAEIVKRLELYVKWPKLGQPFGEKIGGCLVEFINDAPTLIFGLGVNVLDQKPILQNASSLRLEKSMFARRALGMISDVVYNTSNHSRPMEREGSVYWAKDPSTRYRRDNDGSSG